jgi:hypothetical protein
MNVNFVTFLRAADVEAENAVSAVEAVESGEETAGNESWSRREEVAV